MAGRAESAPLASSMLAPMAISLLWRSTKVDDHVVDSDRGRGGGVSEEAAATTSVHDKPRRRGALLHVHGRHCAWCSGRISEPYN